MYEKYIYFVQRQTMRFHVNLQHAGDLIPDKEGHESADLKRRPQKPVPPAGNR